MMKKIRPEYAILLGLFAFLMAIASTVEYRRVVNYLFGDEAVYYMMAQSFAYDFDLEYTQKDLWRVYQDGWHAGPQGIFLTQIANFTLTDDSFQRLRRATLPADVPGKLEVLKGQTIRTRAAFLMAVEQTLDEKLTPEQRKVIVTCAQKTDAKIYYSKSFAYSLLLAPFLAIFGFQGFLILNMLLLFLMIVMGWLYLRDFNAPLFSLVLVVTFFLLSASFIYTFWLTPETFNMFCITLGLFLWLYQKEQQQVRRPSLSSRPSRSFAPFRFAAWLITTPEGRLYLAPIPIAVAGASKLPNVLFMFPIAADILLKVSAGFSRNRRIKSASSSQRWRSSQFWHDARKLVLVCMIFVLVVSLFYVLQYAFTGNFNQYAGDRRTFYWNFPFDSVRDIWDKGIRLSNDDYFEESFYVNPTVLLHNAYYYVFGRFTGLLPYFFCSLIALYYWGRRLFSKDPPALVRRRFLLLLTIGGSIFVYIFMAPGNYQGGGGAFGNRFFVNIYPGFLFLITSLSSLYPLVVSWVVSSLFLAQALINPFQISTYPASQAFRFPYRVLPVELTLLNTLPTNINSHLVQFAMIGQQAAHRLYFFDENIADQTPYDFWVRGEKTAELGVRLSYPRDYLTVTVKNGPRSNQVDVTVGGTTHTIHFSSPQAVKQLVFPLKKGVPYFKTEVYLVKIRSHSGFVPKFTAGSGLNDPRYLGCRVSISSNPFDAGKVLFEQGQSEQAITVLEALLQDYPQHAQAQYYLGMAYQRVHRLEDAMTAIQRGKELLPDFQTTFWTYCRSLDEDCAPNNAVKPPQNPSEATLAELLDPFRLRYEAEDLFFSTGDVVERPGASRGKVLEFHPNRHTPGFLLYGPFQVLPEGQYQVRFRIKTGVAGDAEASSPVAVAFFYDVYGKRQGIIAKERVAVHAGHLFDSAQYREYTLNFDLYSPETVEFRIETTGRASVAVDRVEVYHRLPLQIFEGLAQSQQALGAREDAYRTLRQAVAFDSCSPDIQRAYLQLLFDLRKWEDASQFIQNAVERSEFHTGLLTKFFEQHAEDQELPPDLQRLGKTVRTPFTPDIPMKVLFADRIEFLGYSLSSDQIAPGGTFTIQYVWRALQATNEDYTIFVHFIRKGHLLASETTSKIKRRLGLPVLDMFQQDHEPLNGTYPTQKWIPREFIQEQYEVSVPHELEPGIYEIRIGLWNPLTRQRLRSNGDQNVTIGELQVHDAGMD